MATFEIKGDTTLGELAGILQLIPLYQLRFRVYPSHVKNQRYEVMASSNDDAVLPEVVGRGPSIHAALSQALEHAVRWYVGASSPPEDET